MSQVDCASCRRVLLALTLCLGIAIGTAPVLATSEDGRADPATSTAKSAAGPLSRAADLPVVVQFPHSTVGEVYASLAKATGIDLVFDNSLDLKEETSFSLSQATLRDALHAFMIKHEHFYEVLGPNALFIMPNTRQNRAKHVKQVLRTFHLSNARSKVVQTMLRSLLETRRIFDDSNANSVTVRDSAAVIAAAEKLVAVADRAPGEVLIEMELLEVDGSEIRRITKRGGVDSVSPMLGPLAEDLVSSLREHSATRILARPQLRAIDGERASFSTGEAVPVAETTPPAEETKRGGTVARPAIKYINVGIDTSVRSRIHHDGSVTVDLQIDLSSPKSPASAAGAALWPTISKQKLEMSMRIASGETGVVLTPALEQHQGHRGADATNRELVIVVSPQVLRMPDIREGDDDTITIGTEEYIQLREQPVRISSRQSL